MRSEFYGLAIAFGLQLFCAVFFLYDGIGDALGMENAPGFRETDQFEFILAATLLLSLIFTGLTLRRLATRQKRLTRQIDIAAGAFAEIIDAQFDEWSLTASERDVALLAIKGLSVAEMAELRDTREGTIKAQCGAVYRKAGVSGRLQLISLFIEELLDVAPLRTSTQT